MKPLMERLAIVVLAISAGGCVSKLMEGIAVTREMVQPGGDQAGPSVVEAAHGERSRLPTDIRFAPEGRMGGGDVPGWARSEMGITLALADSLPGPDGEVYLRFQQEHGGVPVRGAAMKARLEDGQVAELTGLVHDGIDIPTSPRVGPDDALNAVLEADEDLTGIGDPELEILPTENASSTPFRLAYRFRLLSRDPAVVVVAYVDAGNGELLGFEPESDSWIGAAGQGQTTEGSTVSFGTQHTDDIPPPEPGEIEIVDLREGYRLFDPQRNLHTMSLGGMTEVDISIYEPRGEGVEWAGWQALAPGHDLIEEDDIWESTPHAVDVHWGMTVTYDYFQSQHGWRGWNGRNGYLPAYVDYFRGFANAFFYPGPNFLAFGDGGAMGRPPTLLDVVAHEYTHAVSETIVPLTWSGEPGSIDEAVSDIFAMGVKFKLGKGDWIMGSGFQDPAYRRDLRDPKASSMPDTYEGEYWGEYRSGFELQLDLHETSKHKNSTVMSHWFYLISEGGKGENDNEEIYDIDAIGMTKAANIVFRALFEMTPAAGFTEVRKATLRVARRLYGRCSDELRATTNAWNAVGVGPPFCDCFEGSFDYYVETEDGVSGMKLYVRGEDFAAEVPAKDGGKQVMFTTAGDPYWHVQGAPDIPTDGPGGPFLKSLFQGRRPLVVPVAPLMSRREYLEYRKRHRTGQTRRLGEFTAYEYRLDDGVVWSTEDVCMDFTDLGALLMLRPPGLGASMRQVFFGFPVRMEQAGEGAFWVENLKAHEVDDRYFQR